MTRVVTFGEIMARLAPPGFLRLRQAVPGTLEVTFAGAEANVAASLVNLGSAAALVTALPDNPLADACVQTLRGLGIDTQYILRANAGRLGLYFVETGANQRPSRVLYDRAGSSISLAAPDAFDWNVIFDGVSWFHVTGITPALSRRAADATLHAVQCAKRHGLTVSCDLNFRGKLWRWEPPTPARDLAGRVMRQVLPHVDVLIANEEDCGDVLGIRAGQTDVEAGQLDVEHYPDMARQVVAQFPNMRFVATTLRQSISASHNNWGAMLLDVVADDAHFAPCRDGAFQPYEIRNIVDRVGGGDAFAAGLIFGLTQGGRTDTSRALDFATAASCLAHSIRGDFNFVSRPEVEALVGGGASGRVVR